MRCTLLNLTLSLALSYYLEMHSLSLDVLELFEVENGSLPRTHVESIIDKLVTNKLGNENLIVEGGFYFDEIYDKEKIEKPIEF